MIDIEKRAPLLQAGYPCLVMNVLFTANSRKSLTATYNMKWPKVMVKLWFEAYFKAIFRVTSIQLPDCGPYSFFSSNRSVFYPFFEVATLLNGAEKSIYTGGKLFRWTSSAALVEALEQLKRFFEIGLYTTHTTGTGLRRFAPGPSTRPRVPWKPLPPV